MATTYGGGGGSRDSHHRLGRVKNKNPAPVQISAEQLLREAVERQEVVAPPPRQQITDADELAEFQARRRTTFEGQVKVQRHNMTVWIRYASFEDSQREFARARSIFERALAVTERDQHVWLRYTEFEMRNKFVNHARNVFDRAVTILPRVDQFWLKWGYMEEKIGNVEAARQIYERWTSWGPGPEAWEHCLKFERRYREFANMREIFKRYIKCHPDPRTWLRYAKFEEDSGELALARQVYNTGIEYLGDEFADDRLYTGWAKFETRIKEYERARFIYKYAIEHLPEDRRPLLTALYTQFERQYGDRSDIETTILERRRKAYEDTVAAQPLDYDAWFDFVRLEEDLGSVSSTRNVYERAIGKVPPTQEKRHWRRYIYLWLQYAAHEEVRAEDTKRAQEVYDACLALVPHKRFTFAKLWLQYARFLIRKDDLPGARKLLGRALGVCPKEKLFKGYIELEIELRDFERCRKLYQQYLKYDPTSASAWMKFADLERQLGDIERARSIYSIATAQAELDMPELLWKAYIDFEFDEGEFDATRALYARLIERTGHVKVWTSWARMEMAVAEQQTSATEKGAGDVRKECVRRARGIFERASTELKARASREDRATLVETWLDFEKKHGDSDSVEKVREKLPRAVRKRRRINPSDPDDMSMEEYMEYIFPDDDVSGPQQKLLEAARKWKERQEQIAREKAVKIPN